MQQLRTHSSESSPVLEALAGTDCQFCDPGTLEAEVYKGNDAAVCAKCGTPAAQIW
ncbi:HVO_A0556 family zinc finger protein [Halomontanus rarus]|uniref:HVO_A0556 family zinc finger protein n=1 Tax=Halomontanus rarus TaxID=3034020 RepID=UPI001A986DF7